LLQRLARKADALKEHNLPNTRQQEDTKENRLHNLLKASYAEVTQFAEIIKSLARKLFQERNLQNFRLAR